MAMHTGDMNAMRDTSDHIRCVKFMRIVFRQYVELMLKVMGRGIADFLTVFFLSRDAIIAKVNMSLASQKILQQ